MDEEQRQKFMEWLHITERVYRVDLEKAWEACLDANKAEEEEPEPSATEMVWRLMGKGWVLKSGRDLHDLCLEDPKTKILYDFTDKDITRAFRRAFPPKRKVEVEVWLDSDGEIRVIPSNSDSKGLDPKRVSWSWTKGTATFYVEESGEG